MFDQAHIGGAERERKIRRKRRGDAEAAGHIDDGVDADSFGQLDGGNVARTGQRAAQGDRAFEFFVVIVRRIGLAAAHHGERRVDDGVERRKPLFDGRRRRRTP